MSIRKLAIGWIVLALLLFALWFAADASAQGPPTVGWFSIPTGPHGTVATPSRYCENDFHVSNTYVIEGTKPDRLCVYLTGPSSTGIFEPAFEVTDVYDNDGEPSVSPTLEYGWACWYGYQLGTISSSSWFVTYDVQVGHPHIDQEVFQNVQVYIGEDMYPGAAGISYWMYDGCYPYDTYLPTILKH